jgi:hypothetical protein
MKDFRTREFPQAAYLKAKGYKLVATSRQRNSLVFHFPESAQKHALDYFNDVAIPCRTFYSAVKELKALIHGLANTMEDSEHVPTTTSNT